MKRMNLKYCMNNDRNFASLYVLTLQICGLAEFPAGTFTDSGNAWLELTESWNDLFTHGSAGIFLDVVHRLMWSVPHVNSVKEYDNVVKIVMEELLADGDAFAVWDSYISCDMAIYLISEDEKPKGINRNVWQFSYEHYRYLSDRMLWNVRYSKSKYRSDYARYEISIRAYEKAIQQLIPVARSWNEAYWCNESHIYNEIFRVYGKDIRKNYDNWTHILFLVMTPYIQGDNYEVSEAYHAACVKHMPMSMAQAIWPQNTEDEILRVYSAAYRNAVSADEMQNTTQQKMALGRPLYGFGMEELKESWIYKRVQKWIYNKCTNPGLREKAKKVEFNLNFAL